MATQSHFRSVAVIRGVILKYAAVQIGIVKNLELGDANLLREKNMVMVSVLVEGYFSGILY